MQIFFAKVRKLQKYFVPLHQFKALSTKTRIEQIFKLKNQRIMKLSEVTTIPSFSFRTTVGWLNANTAFLDFTEYLNDDTNACQADDEVVIDYDADEDYLRNQNADFDNISCASATDPELLCEMYNLYLLQQ